MGYYVFLHPTNGKLKYTTMSATDSNVPAGWVLTSGSDGTQDERQQQYKAGVNSGGYPAYTNDAGMVATQPNHPNGILAGPNYTFTSQNFYGYGVYGRGNYGWGQAYLSGISND